MPTLPGDLIEALEARLVDLVVDSARLLPALEDAWVMAQDESGADWTVDEMPAIARTIVVRGARRIVVNPDQARQDQGGDQVMQLAVTDVFSRDELRRLRAQRRTSRVGSIRLTAPGLAEAGLYDDFLPPEGTHHAGPHSGWLRP